MSQIELLAFVTTAVVLVLLAIILLRSGKKFAAALLMLVSIELLIYSIFGLFYGGRISRTILLAEIPYSIFLTVIPTIIGLLLFVRVFRAFTPSNLNATPDYDNPAILKDATVKILDSENLLTALRSTLPSGKDDEKLGFDHIPFMLSAIDERRKRALRSARFFLIATTVSALIFSAVVIYFGYILVNEASAGTAKTRADIRASTEATSEAVHSIIPSYYNNPDFQKNVVPSLDRLSQLDPGDKNKQAKDTIISAINEAKRTGDLVALNTALGQVASKLTTEGAQEKSYATALGEATNAMSAFMSAQSVAIPELNSRIQELRALIQKADESLSKPENRLPEIVKRLALGLVIATFFLALLRYMGTLYRTRYQQVLAAENDDFMIRRFYVAFKSSEASDEQRKAVLASFMSAQNISTNVKESSDGTKEQYEILKDLLGALSKKL